ncbi:MAG: diguanylate cyclase (GGDEF)-like protein [Kiritimatiellia bacterium]|jgi:diguanylate cyclase (GGDEF)-like protein
MTPWMPILAVDVFSVVWQTGAVAIVCFVVAVLLVSHLRYQRMSLEAHSDDASSMKTGEAFRIRIARYLGSMHREPAPFSTIIFSLDGIDALQREFGDETVDEMMEYILGELKGELRASDSALLYERDRIGLVASVGRDVIEQFLARLHRSSELESFRTRTGVLKKLRVRMGVSTCPENGETVHQMMKAAEGALQRSLDEVDLPWVIAPALDEFAEEAEALEAAEVEPVEAPVPVEEPAPSTAEEAEADEDEEEDENDAAPVGGLLGLLSKKRSAQKKNQDAAVDADEADEDEDDDEEDDAFSKKIDPLTGLLKSERMGGAMQKYVARYRKDEEPVTLLYLDIDSLAQYNDHYGEDAGDAILSKLGEILDHNVRQEDLLGRVGGEEFVIGMNAEPDAAMMAARRLCDVIKGSVVNFGGNKLRFTVCIGVAGFPDHGGVAKTLFDRSLIAMRAAKYRGRSKCMKYDPQLRSSRVADPDEPVTEDAF